MPRKYSEDLKKKALKRYWSWENLDKIALEMNLQTSMIWPKKFINQCYNKNRIFIIMVK
ncbi:hypothetical protein SCORR_v1c06210 [Spiroplasma corruscae]|uniref:Transposase n=1 Tax=Spiroplasma corruscae TaxID=216934 RepID=A0A222EQ72_9MOLU|nr:hypothetical protein [Spiroplasma corruscae]ASP28393.1 hypothetical protein SCORR_v1c06210 [Spiroplasma corruscae]